MTAKFIRRRLIVYARQAVEETAVHERGTLLPVHVGDWLVTSSHDAAQTHVLSDEEFRSDYERVSQSKHPRPPRRTARYRKTALIVEARRATAHDIIVERGKLIPIRQGDWVIKKPTVAAYVISDEDFKRVYRPVDANARKLWHAVASPIWHLESQE
jgi:hypothetical protein